MKPTTLKKLIAAIPQSDTEMEEMVKATLLAQTEREELIAKRDAARAVADEPFAASISRLDNQMARNLELLEAWAEVNRKKFGDAKSISVACHRLGWRLGNWKTEVLGKVTWKHVVDSLRGWVKAAAKCRLPANAKTAEAIKLRASYAKTWLRIKRSIETAKDAMIDAREDETAKGFLKELGVSVIQEESFYLAPDREGQDPPLLSNAV